MEFQRPESPPAAVTGNNPTIEAWYETYLATDLRNGTMGVIDDVDNDVLDEVGIENQIHALTALVDTTSGFCTKCQHGLTNWPHHSDQTSIDLWQLNTLDLAAADRAGCKLCSFFMSQLCWTKHLAIFRKIEARLQLVGKRGASQLTLREGRSLSLTYPCKRLREDVHWYPGSISLCWTCTMPLPYSPKTEIPDIYDAASLWLKTCNDSHDQCQHANNLEHPRRLVSIGDGIIKVVETNSLAVKPQYATLSYCWGQGDFTMLTLETLAPFQEGISLSDLSQTLQDAINVARRLGLDYIWIDALCIIQRQPDHSDWLCESGRMRSIYGGSYVNIAASSATDARRGFISQSQVDHWGLYVPVTSSEGSHRRAVFNHDFAFKGAVSNLAKRAWAFQERLLAPRTLFFSDDGILWECRSMVASPSLFDGLGDALNFEKLVIPEHEEWNWDAIVLAYSRTKLTVISDRLPALAGVARRHYGLMKDQYLAGMWWHRLIEQLDWRVADRVNFERPEWRAPTWSWASVEGRVLPSPLQKRRNFLKGGIFSRVLDAATIPSGPDVFGAVSGGYLTLACSSLVPGVLCASASLNETPSTLGGICEVFIDGSQRRFRISLDCLHYIRNERDAAVYLVPLRDGTQALVSRTPEGARQHRALVAGLVLQRVEGSVGVFHRIGSFHFFKFDPEHLLDPRRPGDRDEFLSVVDKLGASIAASECVGIDPNAGDTDMRYVIEIE